MPDRKDPTLSTIDATKAIMSDLQSPDNDLLELPTAMQGAGLALIESAWAGISSSGGSLDIDASEVEDIDDAGMALLVKIVGVVRNNDRRVIWEPPPSDALLEAAAAAKVEDALGL